MAGINTSSMFANGIKGLSDGTINFDTDTIKAFLMKKSFANTTLTATAVDTFDLVNDVNMTNDGIPSATSKAATITTADITIQTTDDHVLYADGTASVSYSTVSSGAGCGGILVFRSGTDSTNSQLISYNHFSAAVTADGGTVTVNINTSGLFRASY